MKGTVKRGLALLIALLLAVPAFAESENGADGIAAAYAEDAAIETAAVDPEIEESEADFLEDALDFEGDPLSPVPEPEPAEESVTEEPAEEPVTEDPAGEESVGEEPAGEESAEEQPAGEEPAGEEPAGEESGEEEPAGEEPAGEESGEEQPAEEAPVEVEVDLPEEADNPEITLDGETAVAQEDAALAASSVKPSAGYIDADGKPQMHDALILTDDMTSWTTDTADGWYVINEDLTFNDAINVTGDVHLILSDVIKLTANAGIRVGSGNSLTIYAQTTASGMGALEARSVLGVAIGSSGGCGTVTINGGKILAASNNDVGIGGNGGTIVINGGDITATSEEASGIGNANWYSDPTTVTITGVSRVVARGKLDKPGIGGSGQGIVYDSVRLYVGDGLYVYSYIDDQHKTPIDKVDGDYERTPNMAVLTTEPKLSAELDGARFYNDTTSIHQWMKHGGTLKLGREIKLGTDIRQIILNKHDYVNSYTLDCNGFGLRSNKAASDATPAITVDTGATLTLTDTSAKKAGYITGSKGSAVSIKDGGVFRMSGATLRDNTASRGGGVYVCNGGTFAMDGGKITNNTVSFQGGGVYMESGGTFNLSGAPVIAGNQGANVYLLTGNQIAIDGALSTDANVGITMQDSGVFTQNFGKYNDAAPSEFFFSDATALQALKAVGGDCAEAKLGIHAHEYRFHQNTNDDSETLTITCVNTDCGHQGDATVVLAINRPALTVYGDGKNPNATVDEALLNAAGEALGQTLSQGYIQYYSVQNGQRTPLQSAPTDAGDYIASLSIPNSLYNVLTHYTISKRAASITGVSAQSRPYDGTTVAQISGAPAVGGILAGDESGVTLVTENATASFANADAARNKPVTFDGYSLTGERAHNYDLSQPQGLKADITPKTVGLSWANTDLTYNKTAQQPTATATGLVGSDVCAVTVKGSQINASATAYTATASALSNPNYALPEEKTCAFTIAHKVVGLTWSNTSLTYNGSVQKPKATATDLISGDKCDVTLTGEGTNVGDYQATATGLSNANYALPAENLTQAFTIVPKTVGLTWGTASFVYNGQSRAPTATATGVVSGDTCDVTVTGAQTNVGSYTATASALNNANYVLPAANTKAFTIARKVAQLQWSDAAFTYDGQAHAPGCTVTNLETNDTCTVTVTGEKTAAGRYTATASALSNANYALPGSNTKVFTINPKTVGLAWGTSTFTYNGKNQQPAATATGLVGSDVCTITVRGGQINASASAYTATATALSNPNYALPEEKTCAFTIAHKVVGLTWSNTSLTYNGSAQKPRATATGLVSGDLCDVTVTGESTNVGDYQATASGLSNANYALPAENLTQAFSIVPKTVGLTWGTASFVYNGQNRAPTATATGVASGDTCDVTVTGAQTNAGSYTATASALNNTNYILPEANTKAFTIARKVAQLQWSDATFTYDGQAHAPGCTVTNLETNDTCSVTVTGEKTAAGRYTATASILSNSNYALPSTKTQAFTINPRTVELTWGPASFTYNAKTQQPAATATGLIGSDVCTVNVSGGKKDVGDYTATASTLSNANYALPDDKTCAFTIAQKTVGLTWSNTSLTYNGSAQKPKATVTDLISGDKCNVTLTGEGTNVGDYQATATGLTNANYALPAENLTQAFTIVPKTVGLTWGSTTFIFDEQSHAPTATATGLIGADVCDVTVTGAQTNVGNYTATASALNNANYALPASCTVSFKIQDNNADKPVETKDTDMTFGTLPTTSTPSTTTATTTPAGPTVLPINVLKKSVRAKAMVGNLYQIVWGSATATKFKSSKARVATVSSTGQVIPRAAGKTKITFKVGKKKRTLTLTVKDPTIPGRVTLTAPTTAAKIGDAIPLTVTLPAGTSSPIKWTSSNRKVATVVNGVVTFKKAGRVTITATATRGKKKARVTFKVSK